ncbi:MAG: GlsB/YeaQ/YmgE family stress response membrane protein [Bacteroides sp.]|nr:GlsB/YeaQ/YmgE family stress response membrane protein [Roseburia sp.]MCM1345903.1 GlsB/YeaQ/YmgE family stress response membrane protein [Bacteroides sp.]MCM1421380.1 GlsB/YeaQ/YmgE family stress response membrane protein [Bacteroides sp.]
MGFIWYIIIGILSGFIAGKIMRGSGFGVFINLIVGIVGGLLGGWCFGLLGITTAGILGSLVTSVAGAILLLWILSLFRRNRIHEE